MPTYYDLSHRIETGMTFYPGDPKPAINPIRVGSSWQVTQLQLGTHTGTHIDAASHFFAQGSSIDQYPLERFVLPGIIASIGEVAEDQPIHREQLADYLRSFEKGGALIIQTGWDCYWKTERYFHHPYFAPDFAQAIVEAGASLVGVDALNVDSTTQETQDAHAILLGNDVLIVENLAGLSNLIPGKPYKFSFLPLFIPAMDGSPVRAIAWEEAAGT